MFILNACVQTTSEQANMPLISVQLHSVKQHVAEDFEGTLRSIAKMGFDGVEFAGRYGPYQNDPEGLKAFLASIDLSASGAHIPLNQLQGDKGLKNLAFFERAGITLLIVPHDKRIDDPSRIDELITELVDTSSRANLYGIKLGYHNHAMEFKSFNDTTFWDYLAINTPPEFVLQLDAGWANFANISPTDYVKRYPGRTITAHYKVRTYQGKPSQVNSDTKVILGQDKFDWANLINTSIKYGGSEWIVIEQEEYPSPLTPLESVQASMKGLQAILNGMSTKTESSNKLATAPSPDNLLTDGHTYPLNIHNVKPSLSWQANIPQQIAYQIQVASSESKLLMDKADLWDSGKVVDTNSRHIVYAGEPLNSNDSAYWRVRVWQLDAESPKPWSQTSKWEMGLLNKKDWQAKWLQHHTPFTAESSENLTKWVELVGIVENEDGSIDSPALDKLHAMPSASLFRRDFNTSKTLVRAKLHSTAGGYYEIFVNGKRVKDRIMDPGQTDFDKRILYNTDDVSHLIQKGVNTIAVHLGSGWYDENIAFSRWKNPDGEYSNRKNGSYTFGQPTFIAQLELTFSDGSKQIVASDAEWLSHPSPVVKEGIFSGEVFNANKNIVNWHTTEAPTTNWQKVKVLEQWPTLQLEPQLLPPIRPIKEMYPIEVFNPQENVWVFDFGQNFTGIPTLNLDSLALAEGQAVYMRFAEWADEKGNISQLSGGSWATHLNAVNAYIAAESNASEWTPSFSWHGFRYIEITGLKQAPTLDSLKANLVRSDVNRVGNFKSSDPLINRIHDTALWTYESNLMSVPLDCPIREKAGWTGDAHAALITGNYNFNMQSFWPKYLGDFKTAENIAPTVVPGKRTGAEKVDWAVAEVFIAWEHYRHYGDIQVLQLQYESLLEYMAFGQSQMSNFLISNGYGDWCDPVPAPGTPRVGGRGTPQWTSTTVTSTALFTQAADYMSKIADVLDKPGDSERFRVLNKNLKTGFHQALYQADTGHYGSQTADAMALRFDIIPDELKQSVADALNNDVVNKWNGHSSVGALGQTWLYLALSDYGYADTAFNIFKAKGYPGFSYLFDELNGTTLWERKGAYDPNQERGPLRSLNHPFHSGYDGWFYEGLGGIRPLENSIGFQEFMLKPVFPSMLNEANVKYETGYGQILSHWVRDGDKVRWRITVPNNTKAWVYLPGKAKQVYSAGSYNFTF